MPPDGVMPSLGPTPSSVVTRTSIRIQTHKTRRFSAPIPRTCCGYSVSSKRRYPCCFKPPVPVPPYLLKMLMLRYVLVEAFF